MATFSIFRHRSGKRSGLCLVWGVSRAGSACGKLRERQKTGGRLSRCKLGKYVRSGVRYLLPMFCHSSQNSHLVCSASLVPPAVPCLSCCWASHRARTLSTCSICSSVSGFPRGIWCHFCRQPRQHVAVACWATKIGCPRIGVCRPSFFGSAGASRSTMNCRPCSKTTGSVFSARYARSFTPSRNRLRNLLLARAVKRSSRLRMEKPVQRPSEITPLPRFSGEGPGGRAGLSTKFQSYSRAARLTYNDFLTPSHSKIVFSIITQPSAAGNPTIKM